jgi:HK97 family phage prohead protease
MERLEFAATADMDGNVMSGIVHVFGTRTMRDGIVHTFAPGSLQGDPLAFYSHDTTKPLARPTISIDGDTVRYRMELGHQSYAEDLRENVRLGLMASMSFGVHPRKWTDTKEDGRTVRTHTEAGWYDISPVAVPAFAGTDAQLHSGTDRRVTMARARARVLEGLQNVR